MRRRKSAIFFLILGISLVALAVALNVGWIFLNLQQIAMLVLGIVFFALIITGLILNMIFLIREIRRNEQQNAFLNAMTHELKTPIASIKLYLETMKSRNLSEEKRQEFYDVMLKDSDRLLHTVESVLQASRTKESQRSLNISKIDAQKLMTETVGIIRKQHNLNEETIKFIELQKEILIFADEKELKTVFSNLLENAVKYSEDFVNIVVKFRETSNNYVEIRITDKGIGLASNELKTIFRRFYRAQNEKTDKTKGTGLGLFIVKEIIKKIGGKIIAKSHGLGKGTTFIIKLPTILKDGSMVVKKKFIRGKF